MIYQWKKGAHSPVSLKAQDVGERLERLRSKGELTAEVVVEDARPPESVLHPAFEWDDRAAAEEYRREQARLLIRSIVVPISDESEQTVRAFVVVTELGEDSYEAIHLVMENAQLRAQVLTRAMREFKAWQTRYQDFAELAKVFAAGAKVKVSA